MPIINSIACKTKKLAYFIHILEFHYNMLHIPCRYAIRDRSLTDTGRLAASGGSICVVTRFVTNLTGVPRQVHNAS